MTDLRDAVSVVTGGGSGIGAGIARALRDGGAQVVLADLDEDRGVATAAAIGAVFVRTDVSDAASVADLHDEVLTRFGRIDVLVNNAGIGPESLIAEMTLDDWRWLVDVNLWGVIHGVTAFLPGMRERGAGHIVTVASMSAIAPMSPLGAYAVTKAGVATLTEVLAEELSGTSVSATLVLPGPTHSDLGRSLRTRPPGSTGSLRNFDINVADELFRTADEVGVMVADAIVGNAPFVITHPELRPRVQARHERLGAAFAEASIRDRERPSSRS